MVFIIRENLVSNIYHRVNLVDIQIDIWKFHHRTYSCRKWNATRWVRIDHWKLIYGFFHKSTGWILEFIQILLPSSEPNWKAEFIETWKDFGISWDEDNNDFSIPGSYSAILIFSVSSDRSFLVSNFKLVFYFPERELIHFPNGVSFEGDRLKVIFQLCLKRKLWSFSRIYRLTGNSMYIRQDKIED